MYGQRVRLAYWARIRGDLFSRLVSPGDRTDPYALYEQLRAEGDLVPTRLGNYSTTRHRICQEVLRSRSFGVSPLDGVDQVHGELIDLSLLTINPPDHTRIRRLAAPAFTPRRLDGYIPLIDTAIDELLDDCERRGRFDLMADFASPLPITVMTQLLGLPNDPERFRRLGSTIARALDGVWSVRQARAVAAADAELARLFSALLAERTGDRSGDDLVAGLVGEQGHRLSESELASLTRLLLIAGFETTVNAIGNGVRWLLHDRSQWELLVSEPERAAAVTEEVLRFDPPVQQTVRVAHRDVELAGTRIEKDQWVVTLLAAANRDPDVFVDPDRFDITRSDAGEHLAFSGGIHYCLGSPLARLELSRALRALAVRFPSLRCDGPLVMRPGTTLRGPERLPVVV